MTSSFAGRKAQKGGWCDHQQVLKSTYYINCRICPNTHIPERSHSLGIICRSPFNGSLPPSINHCTRSFTTSLLLPASSSRAKTPTKADRPLPPSVYLPIVLIYNVR